ncbi:MAG: phosphatase PAP2 family protein [Planctomycetes bacterium]|nr:phosphatase PAP2 family protein [Planctomycetota bacterium]
MTVSAASTSGRGTVPRAQLGVLLALAVATGVAFWMESSGPGIKNWLLKQFEVEGIGLHTVWAIVSDIGLGETIALISLTVFVITGSRRRLQDTAVAAITAGLLVNLLKVVVMRERPIPNASFAWPSGHSAAAAALVGALSGWRPRITAVGWLGALGVAASRLMRGRHWVSDVCGGMFLGYLCGVVVQRLPLWLPAWLERERVRLCIAWCVVGGWCVLLLRLPTNSGMDLLTNLAPVLACGLWAASRSVERSREGSVLQQWPRAGYLALFLAVVLIARLGSDRFALIDVDEPRFAAASRTMLNTGDWIVPWFNGHERFDKPVFIYWMQAAAMALIDPIEAAARLPSALGVALAALATAGIGRLLGLGRAAALLAGLIAGTAPLAQALAHGSTADGLLYGLVTGVGFVQVLRFRRGPTAGTWWALWLGVGIAFLTKGPPALVGPIALGLGLRWAGARAALGPTLGGIALALGVVAAWAVPALIQTDGGFFTRGVMYHVVERSVRPFEGHGGFAPWWLLTYLVTIPLTMLPWSLLLPWAVATLRGRVPEGAIAADLPVVQVRRMLLGWTAGIVLTFTLVVSKLPHYVLPCYPALALALAIGYRAEVMPRVAVLCRVVGVLLALALPIAVVATGLDGAIAPVVVTGSVFAFTMWMCGRWFARGRTAHALAGMAIGVCLGQAVWFGRALPMANRQMLARAFAAELPAQVRAGESLHLYKLVVPTATFYLDRPTPLAEDESSALRLLGEPGKLLLVRTRDTDDLLRATEQLALRDPDAARHAKDALSVPLWTGRGFLPTKGKIVEVRLCGRRLGSR